MAETGGVEVDVEEPDAEEIDIARFDQMRLRRANRNSDSEDTAYVQPSQIINSC